MTSNSITIMLFIFFSFGNINHKSFTNTFYHQQNENEWLRAFTAVELKSYNAILAPLIYQKHLTAVVVKQKIFADLLQCTSIDRCAL